MALASLKESKGETTELSSRYETAAETVGSDEPTDPRPLPVTHGRHLDVNKVLERSLPRVSDEV
jgi:hypothetical protein